MSELEGLHIMKGREGLSKVDLWSIDIQRELETILRELREELNLFICGIAAENSALIHQMKVDEIMILRSAGREARGRRLKGAEEVESLAPLPSLQVLLTGGAPIIDLSDILTSLMNFLEEVRRRRVEATLAEEPLPMLQEDLVKRMKLLSLEILTTLQRIFKARSSEVGFLDLLEERRDLRWVEVFIILLFLYMDNLIDLEPLESESEGIIDIIIRPASEG